METGDQDPDSASMEVDGGGGLVTMDTNDEMKGEAYDLAGENSADMLDDREENGGEEWSVPWQEDDRIWQTWHLPEGVCRKRILQQGEGLYGPGQHAECQVTVQGQCDLDLALTGYPPGQGSVLLGAGVTPISTLIDQAVATMKRTEVAEVCVSEMKTTPGQFVFHVTLHDFTSATPTWRLTSMEKCAAARERKEKGAQYFKDGNVYAAFFQFRAATRLLLSVHPYSFADTGDEATDQAYQQLLCLCRLNLAACQMKTGHYGHVIANCSHALDFDPANVKAMYRRASANASLGNYLLAQEDLQEGLRKEPANRAMAELLQKVNQHLTATQTDLSVGMKKMFS